MTGPSRNTGKLLSVPPSTIIAETMSTSGWGMSRKLLNL